MQQSFREIFQDVELDCEAEHCAEESEQSTYLALIIQDNLLENASLKAWLSQDRQCCMRLQLI